MDTKKMTPVGSGGQTKTSPNQDAEVSASSDTVMVSDGQAGDTDSCEYSVTPKLTAEHLDELRSSAISDDVIASSGVYSARTVEAVPAPLRYLAENNPATLPMLVVPMKEVGAGTTYQVKPQPGSVCDSKGRPKKYVGPAKDNEWGTPLPALTVLRAVTEDTKIVQIVEGTKQALAALSHTDETTAVYRITGIWGWKGMQNYAVLAQFMGHYVCIIPDADASTNRRVYDGAREFRELLIQWGATPVRFVQVPGQGKQGLDDVLASLPEDKRAEMLELWIDKAQDKPARKMPKMPEMPGGVADESELDALLETIRYPGSELMDIHEGNEETRNEKIFEIVNEKFGGETLFSQGQRAVQMLHRPATSVSDNRRCDVVPITRSNGMSLIRRSVTTFMMMKNGARSVSLPGAEVDNVFQSDAVKDLPPLNGVVHSPVVTESGRMILHSGYDVETGLEFDLDPAVEGLEVPANPTEQEANEALDLLREMFCDFPFEDESDFFHVLAWMITSIVRLWLDAVPALAVTGSGPSVGKEKLMKAMAILLTGDALPVSTCPNNDEEWGKVLTSVYAAGHSHMHFDEPPREIDSRYLRSAITGKTYTGRVLGESRHISVRNILMMAFTGNNVRFSRDMARRIYYCRLSTNEDHAETRSDFKHSPLEDWVLENRGPLMTALLTLIQSWIAADKPKPPSGRADGSFEKWYQVVGGVIVHAGFEDFFADIEQQRRERNDGEIADIQHLHWLYKYVQDSEFYNFEDGFRSWDIERIISNIGEQMDLEDSKDVLWKRLGMADAHVPLPDGIYGLQDAKAYSLQRVYNFLKNRNLEGLAVKQVETPKFADLRYRIVWLGDPEDDPLGPGNGDPDDADDDGGDGSGGGTPPPSPAPTPAPAPAAAEPDTPTAFADSTTVVFDTETGSADDAHVTDDPGFVRLATYSVGGSEPVATTDIAGELIPLLEQADTIVGHNIVQYDLAVLQRLYGLDVGALIKAGKVRDTLIMSRLAAGGDRNLKYNLDAVARRYGVDGKLLAGSESALKALAKQYGGFDKIPVNNPEYVEYALQDVRANVAVYAKLVPVTIEAVGEDYLRREHEKMHALSVVESHGVRVDTAKVEELLAEEAQIKAEIRDWLVDTVGMPDEGKQPWSSNSGKQAIADYLDSFGVAAPRTAKGAISTSAKALGDLAEKHAGVPEIVELAAKMETLLQSSTPASTIKKYLRGERVYPHITSSQATGRLSTTNPGMTVFGSRDERLIRQREMIVADSANEELISVDLSQIDARCMAAGSGDAAYAALFAPGRDAHTEMAIRVFGDASRRSDAKALGHAANYGMGPKSFAAHAGISEVEAKEQLDRLHFEFPQLEAFKDHLRKHAEALGWIATGFGRRVTVDRAKAYTQAPAAYGQGTARDVFLEGVLNLPAEVLEMVRIFVHDEIVLSVPRDRAEDIKRTVMDAFKAVALPCKGGVDVPVLSDSAGPAASWAGCKD